MKQSSKFYILFDNPFKTIPSLQKWHHPLIRYEEWSLYIDYLKIATRTRGSIWYWREVTPLVGDTAVGPLDQENESLELVFISRNAYAKFQELTYL